MDTSLIQLVGETAELTTICLAGLMVLVLAVRCKRKGLPETWVTLYLDFDLRAFKLFLCGFFASGLAISFIFFVELTSGLIAIERLSLNAAWLRTLVALSIVGVLFEELMHRVLALNALLVVLRPSLALLAGALLFGLIHADNPEATWISVLSSSLGGGLYGLAYLASRSLWTPFGLHLGWNLFQGPIFGFPVSGYTQSALLSQEATGPSLLTGGDYGPEGGLIGLSARLLLVCVAGFFLLKYKQNGVAPVQQRRR